MILIMKVLLHNEYKIINLWYPTYVYQFFNFPCNYKNRVLACFQTRPKATRKGFRNVDLNYIIYIDYILMFFLINYNYYYYYNRQPMGKWQLPAADERIKNYYYYFFFWGTLFLRKVYLKNFNIKNKNERIVYRQTFNGKSCWARGQRPASAPRVTDLTVQVCCFSFKYWSFSN